MNPYMVYEPETLLGFIFVFKARPRVSGGGALGRGEVSSDKQRKTFGECVL